MKAITKTIMEVNFLNLNQNSKNKDLINTNNKKMTN